MGANAPILYHSPLNMLHQAAYKQENAWERPYSPHKLFGNWGQSTKALVRRWLKISIVIPLTPLIIYVSQRTGLNTYLAFSITKFPSFADVLSTSYKRLSLLRWIGAVHQRTVSYMLSTGLSTHPLHLNNETPCNLTYRVCARRPCWRSKTIKLFSFGKKFNSHAKIFLLFSPPTWPPRTYSIVYFLLRKIITP